LELFGEKLLQVFLGIIHILRKIVTNPTLLREIWRAVLRPDNNRSIRKTKSEHLSSQCASIESLRLLYNQNLATTFRNKDKKRIVVSIAFIE